MREARVKLGALFEPAPTRWGLRGDPVLWRAMRDDLAETDCPPTRVLLDAALERAFERLTGVALTHDGDVRVPSLDRGGMSGGVVSLGFWRTHAMPLLRARWEALAARQAR